MQYGLGPEKTVVGDDVCIDVTEHLDNNIVIKKWVMTSFHRKDETLSRILGYNFFQD
jgi:hypothetical protein